MWRVIIKLLGTAALFGGGVLLGTYLSGEKSTTLEEERLRKREKELKGLEDELRKREELTARQSAALKEKRGHPGAPVEHGAAGTAKKAPVDEIRLAHRNLFDAIEANDSYSVYGFIDDVNAIVDAGLGERAIHWASAAGAADVVNLLISLGADINASDMNGITPLHSAALHGHISVIDILIEKGAGVNKPSSNGSTALHRAVSSEHAGTVELLLARGARAHVADKAGRTALDLARETGNKKIIDLLEASGAGK
ncbi:MAG: ankyrin repeat domain-containing protein [Candidatus Eremiobacteraeota bacterium]|nr:ankyrin repeat domain-containing protein [Candidatus Eremiobacteraeota bacterium]